MNQGKIFDWLASWIGESLAAKVISFLRIVFSAFLVYFVGELLKVNWSKPNWKLLGAALIGAFPQFLKWLLPILVNWLATAKKNGA